MLDGADHLIDREATCFLRFSRAILKRFAVRLSLSNIGGRHGGGRRRRKRLEIRVERAYIVGCLGSSHIVQSRCVGTFDCLRIRE